MSDRDKIIDYVTNTPHNTNPAILRQMLAGMSGSTDWNNITNKPFYAQEKLIPLLEETEIEIPYEKDNCFWASFSLIDEADFKGKLLITFNNKKYTCVVKHVWVFAPPDGIPRDTAYVGNCEFSMADISGEQIYTEEPFWIDQGSIGWDKKEGERITLSIDKIEEEVIPLESKFIESSNFIINASVTITEDNEVSCSLDKSRQQIEEAFKRGSLLHLKVDFLQTGSYIVMPMTGYEYWGERLYIYFSSFDVYSFDIAYCTLKFNSFDQLDIEFNQANFMELLENLIESNSGE